MPDSLTLRAIADHFADCDGISDPQERKSQLRQLRAITQAGIIFPDASVSQGQTAVFSAVKVAQLRVLQALLDTGFKGPVLGKFAAHLTKTPNTGAAGDGPGTMIAFAVEGTRNGEDWVLDIRVSRRPDSDVPEYLGGLRRADETRNSASDQILAAGRVLYAAITLPVSDLIRPVLDAMDAN
tara:strand:- start:1727 stop:2272 length:546 start_codon:yes stop_codon:yes gene_type:complete